MGKLSIWLRNKRALSPIFATMLLASIILVFGSVAYYYASNATTTATNNYVSTISDSQQAISERIAFENVIYSSSSHLLTIYIINSGIANNVKLNSIFIYDAQHNIVGSPSNSITLTPLAPTIITNSQLNVGQEAYFMYTVTLNPGFLYTIHLITKSGSSFDYDFTV